MDLAFTTVAVLGAARAADLLNDAFADYFVRIPFSEASLGLAEKMDDVRPALSPVVLLGGQAVGVALVACRGRESRVAGMGLLLSARGRGAGRALVGHLLAAARARGDRRMVLEVIGQNEAAIRLYEAAGFTRQRRLAGFAGLVPTGLAADAALVETTVRDVAAAIAREAAVDWPWQISAETIARLPAPAVGYTLDGAWTVVLNPAGPASVFRGLAVEGGERRDERTARLLRAVMARHPAATEWRMSALLPEEFAGGFTAAGLARTELYQWQMEHRLG
jgi:GNAT superfamily N-acetyltransferase